MLADKGHLGKVIMASQLLRFRDLKDRSIVSNHVTLGRWIAREGFPPGFMLGPNTRVWREDEIDAWLDSRPTDNTLLRGAALANAEGTSVVIYLDQHSEPNEIARTLGENWAPRPVSHCDDNRYAIHRTPNVRDRRERTYGGE